MQRSRPLTIIAHLLCWLFFYSMVVSFLALSPGGGNLWPKFISPPYLLFYFIFPALFYLNTWWLLPRFFLSKKYFFYFGIIVLLFALVYWLKPFDPLMHPGPSPDRPQPPPGPAPPGDRPPGPGGPQIDIVSVILFILVWSLSSAVVLFQQWRNTERRVLQAESDKANAELSFLKAQINPHFLFNTLNNIYSQIITKNENAGEGIMKLSNIMRYVTDDVRENFVPLESEIGCMRDYIDLQKIRLGANMSVELQVTGRTTDKMIAPLLLMTFVENAFMYGTSSHEPSDIIIKLTAAEHSIRFYCQNKLFETKRNPERTGIGISNARQRLQHLYGERHSLEIKTNGSFFTVELKLLT